MSSQALAALDENELIRRNQALIEQQNRESEKEQRDGDLSRVEEEKEFSDDEGGEIDSEEIIENNVS